VGLELALERTELTLYTLVAKKVALALGLNHHIDSTVHDKMKWISVLWELHN